MKIFFGVHEVRLFRPNGIAVGYFDSWESALKAVESEPTQYKAAYFTLNPLKLPEGIQVNPPSLRSASNAAGTSDIARRVWLLIDCDPPRQSKTNSTAEEKGAARQQAERLREWLGSHGWPEPVLADSGNGWHLLYRIDLANDETTKALLERFLCRLKQLFPMVDAGNFDAPRLCKLYGSWARKGEHSDERPWRRSGIVEEGSGTIVTKEQLRALAPVPESPSTAAQRAKGDEDLSRLLGFLECYEVPLRSEPREVKDGWQIEIECPWADEHAGESRRDTVVSFIAERGYGFKCFHGHCVGRTWRDFRAKVQSHFPDKKFTFVESSATIGKHDAPKADVPNPEPSNGRWLSPDKAAHLFSTREELENAKPLSFFIEDFLPDDGVTAIGAPVSSRKSLIAQNMTRSLVTGEPLFGHFKVKKRPARVLYLVPELTRTSLKKRLEGLGLMPYVGDSLLCRTLNEQGKLWLDDPALRPFLPDSVVFLDTAIRFMDGSENDSGDMQRFSEQIFGLLRDGAACVVVLHHSRKTGKDGGELSLDACMRGSGELAAFLTTCWATRLNGDDAYESPSILKNVKQRDMETTIFEVTSDRATGKLTLVPGSIGNATFTKPQNRANKDGKDDKRVQFLRDNPNLSDREAAAALKQLKMGRGREWVREKRLELAMESGSIPLKLGGVSIGPEQ